jgi:hypothetical protein
VRAVRDAGVAEKNRVDVQIRRDRQLKKGGKVTRMEEAKELEKVVVKLRTRAGIKEGIIKDEEPARGASERELGEVRVSLFSSLIFAFADIKVSSKLHWRQKRCKWTLSQPSIISSRKSTPLRRQRSPLLSSQDSLAPPRNRLAVEDTLAR